MTKFNVIIILLDGARVDRLSICPTFTSLAKKGTLFTTCITYAPSTIASMHAYFTGTYGSENGVNNYWATNKLKKDQYKTLTQYFQENGYYTRGDLINELVLPKDGFDKCTIHNEYGDDITALHTRMVGDMKLKHEGGQPFFLYLHYPIIHARTTKNVMDKFDGEYDERYYKNKEENKKNFDKYMLEADEYLKAVYDEVKEQGLEDSTLIVVLSDHGTGIGEKLGERRYGVFCYDYTTKVFALFAHPKLFPTIEIKKQIRTIDIMPTLLDVLGFEKDPQLATLRGLSLMPIIKGTEKGHRLAFTETATHDEPTRGRPTLGSVRSDKWKLIFNKITNSVEFYNLTEDPEEQKNLAGMGIEEEKLFWHVLKEEMKLGENHG